MGDRVQKPNVEFGQTLDGNPDVIHILKDVGGNYACCGTYIWGATRKYNNVPRGKRVCGNCSRTSYGKKKLNG